MNQKLKEILVSISFSHLFPIIILSFVDFQRSIMIFTIGYQFNTFMWGFMKNNCEDANLGELSVLIHDEFFVFMKLALLSINANSFLFEFLYMYLYVHIVLEIRNPSESRALAHSRLISRQSTLHLKILLQIFGPTCPVCLHVYDCSKEMCRA